MTCSPTRCSSRPTDTTLHRPPQTSTLTDLHIRRGKNGSTTAMSLASTMAHHYTASLHPIPTPTPTVINSQPPSIHFTTSQTSYLHRGRRRRCCASPRPSPRRPLLERIASQKWWSSTPTRTAPHPTPWKPPTPQHNDPAPQSKKPHITRKVTSPPYSTHHSSNKSTARFILL
jgi:hypothetical protein